MAKICGAVSLTGGNAVSVCKLLGECLTERHARHLHSRPYKLDVVAHGRAAFGLLAMGEHDASLDWLADPNDYKIAVLSSPVFLRNTEFTRMRSEMGESESDANGLRLLLRTYSASGPKAFSEANGFFALASWDESTGTLLLANDKLGLAPLYVAHDRDMIVFASEAEAIAKAVPATAEPDEEAVGEFFALGQVLGERTFYSKIKNLPPATIRTYTVNGAIDTTYYTFAPKNLQSLEEAELVREIVKAFTDAVDRRSLSQHVRIRLSGGLDSRFILGTLLRLGKDVTGETFFLESCEKEADPAYAQLLAKHCGIDIYFVKKQANSTLTDRVRGITKSEHKAFNGIFGGELLGGMALDITKTDIATANSTLRRVLSSSFIRRLARKPRSAAQQFMSSLPFASCQAKKPYYYFTNSARSFLSTEQGIGWERPTFFFVGNGLYPFIDPSFLEVVLAIPYRLAKGRRFYVRLLQKEFPHLMRIPWIPKHSDATPCPVPHSGGLANYKDVEAPRHAREYMARAAEILEARGKNLRHLYRNPTKLAQGGKDKISPIFERFVLFELWNRIHGPII